MAYINVQVFCDGDDITDKVISYDRDKSLCTSLGQLRLETTRDFTPSIYDEVVLYEGGVKKGTYYVHTYDRSYPKSSQTLACQDASIKVQTYFIAESYLVDYESTSDYWIKKFLTAATVSWTFDDGDNGSLVNNNTAFGKQTAMDAIVPLLQQNGWYLSFDADNTAHIGKLNVDTANYADILDDNEIISINTNNHDKMFRNRVVVWGTGNPGTGRWVFSDLDRSGQYANEFDDNDVRTTVISNSSIRDASAANLIAFRALKEFDKVNFEITVEVAGHKDLDIGDVVFINSTRLQAGGMITSIGSSLSDRGLVTHMVLNQRCPRLFAYYDYGGMIYVSTWGAGVWRKPLTGTHTWTDFSQGLTDLYVHDLIVDNGVFACATEQGHCFVRTEADATWRYFQPDFYDEFDDIHYPVACGVCTSVTIDKNNGDIIAGFSLRGTNPARSWIYNITSASEYTRYQLYDEDEIPGYTIVDIDNNAVNNTVSVVANFSGEVIMWNGHGLAAAPNYYTFPNTVSGIDIGITQTIFPENLGTLYNKSVQADGKYIYEIDEGGTRVEDHGFVEFITVKEINTKDGTQMFYTFTNNDRTTNIELVQAVANRTVACVFYDNEREKIVIDRYSFRKEKLKSIEFDGSFFPVASAFVIEEGERHLYILAENTENPQNFVMLMWDCDKYFVIAEAYGSFSGSSAWGGSFGSAYGINAMGITEDYLIWNMIAAYTDVPYDYDDEVTDVTINCPVGMLYHRKNRELYFSDGPASAIAGGDDTLSPLMTDSISAFGVKGNYGYIAISADYLEGGITVRKDMIVKFSRFGGATVTYTIDASSATVGRFFICNDDDIFACVNNGSLNFSLIDADTGLFIRFVPYDLGRLAVARQMAEDKSFFFYNADNGNVYRYPTTSGTTGIYATGVEPYENAVYHFNNDSSVAALVFDTFLVSAASTWSQSSRYTSTVLVPASGRAFNLDFTKWAVDDALVFQGFQDDLYEEVMDTAMAYNVEISKTTPVVVYGSIIYSGLAISGVQTGYNQGQIYVSPNGGEDRYSEVILDATKSLVPETRVAAWPNDDNEYVDYLLFTQPDSEMISEAITTDLVAVSLENLTYTPGVIMARGTVGNMATVLNTFNGFANHVETTKYPDYPYIFVSISGVPPVFWQKDGYNSGEEATIFVDRTNNLPSAAITKIRCDDQI